MLFYHGTEKLRRSTNKKLTENMMATVANEIFDIMNLLNSMKTNQFKLEDIFEMIHNNDGIVVDNFMMSDIVDFLHEHQLSASKVKPITNFDLSKYPFSKKEKRYLN